MARYSQMLGVFLAADGSGALIGVWPDGSEDRIAGTLEELKPIVVAILAGCYLPERQREIETRPPFMAVH